MDLDFRERRLLILFESQISMQRDKGNNKRKCLKTIHNSLIRYFNDQELITKKKKKAKSLKRN